MKHKIGDEISLAIYDSHIWGEIKYKKGIPKAIFLFKGMPNTLTENKPDLIIPIKEINNFITYLNFVKEKIFNFKIKQKKFEGEYIQKKPKPLPRKERRTEYVNM